MELFQAPSSLKRSVDAPMGGLIPGEKMNCNLVQLKVKMFYWSSYHSNFVSSCKSQMSIATLHRTCWSFSCWMFSKSLGWIFIVYIVQKISRDPPKLLYGYIFSCHYHFCIIKLCTLMERWHIYSVYYTYLCLPPRKVWEFSSIFEVNFTGNHRVRFAWWILHIVILSDITKENLEKVCSLSLSMYGIGL